MRFGDEYEVAVSKKVVDFVPFFALLFSFAVEEALCVPCGTRVVAVVGDAPVVLRVVYLLVRMIVGVVRIWYVLTML